MCDPERICVFTPVILLLQVRNNKKTAILVKEINTKKRLFLVYRPNTGKQLKLETYADIRKKCKKVPAPCSLFCLMSPHEFPKPCATAVCHY